MSEQVADTFINISVTALERTISDHRPIILKNENWDYGPYPFKFFDSWLGMEGFDELVREAWSQYPIGSNNNKFILFKDKIKYLKENIKKWNTTCKLTNTSLRKTKDATKNKGN